MRAPAVGLFFAADTEEELVKAAADTAAVTHAHSLGCEGAVLIAMATALSYNDMGSQDIMEHLELSQSASSRHLKQLSATGYLIERRCNGAKCYELNAERVEDTVQALGNFLLGT